MALGEMDGKKTPSVGMPMDRMFRSDKPPRYRAYLLRFWEEGSHHSDWLAEWRFSLEDPHTGERLGFASLEKLVAFLRQTMNRARPSDPEHSQPS
jgi:hypothetical protein